MIRKEEHEVTQNEINRKCSCNVQHSTPSGSKLSNRNSNRKKTNLDLECATPTTTTPLKNERKLYNKNFESSIEIDKLSMHSVDDESLHISKYFPNEIIRNDINDMDLIGTCNTLSDLTPDHFTVNNSEAEHEQAHIIECLLELDDYLEKMDESCSLNGKTNIKLKKSPLLNKHSTKVNTQFERGSKWRNTTGCSQSTQKIVPERKAESSYGTWTKKNSRKCTTQQQEIEIIHPDIDNEIVQCSINTNKSKSSKNIYNPLFELGTKQEVAINDQMNSDSDRPRQLERRAERFSTLSSHSNNITQDVHYDDPRPTSTANTISTTEIPNHDNIYYTGSDGSTTSVSIESSTDTSDSLPISDILEGQNIGVIEDNDQSCSQPIDAENMDPSAKSNFNTYWPHKCSRTFALISCTLGLFNINRFAILTINYRGNFLIQFCILSIIFGIPFLWLQMSLGAKIKAGPISMWKISPLCIGIGISITFVQYIITIYSSVAVVWLLKYIQDIFIYKTHYPWAESVHHNFNGLSQIYTNLTESVPYYFNVNVLQRTQILRISEENGLHLHINDRLAIYLTLVWGAIFLALCKGLKSLGKFILFLGIVPIVFLAIIAVKLLCAVDFGELQNVFSSTELDDFLVNSKPWIAAAQEVFLTWSLLGASVIAISSRTHHNSNKSELRKDAILVVLVTFIGLCLSALIGLCSIQLLNELDYIYVPGSYETPQYYSAIYSLKSLKRTDLISYPTEFAPHFSTLVGEVYIRHTDTKNVSGYQVLRFVTEILPAALVISAEKFSWIWSSILFIALFLFGVSQLCVMWKPISCSLGNSSSAVLLSCVTGLLLSIPFVTETGMSLIYYMDILLGGAWFIPILWCVEIFGVFLIRGRPYNGDDLVNDLKMSGSMSAFLALSWNILLPIGLVTLAVIEYKVSSSNQFYHWRGQSYFNNLTRKFGALTQIGFLLLIPIIAAIQIYRYLTSGPSDILDRIQMLYRPLEEFEDNQARYRNNRSMSASHNENRQNSLNDEDNPPKYTPPPSYTTATGAKLAKILHQSFRRSIRRILRKSEQPAPTLRETQNEHALAGNSPILVAEETNISMSESIEIENRPTNLIYGRSLSLDRKQVLRKCHLKQPSESSVSQANHIIRSSRKRYNRPYTAEDVMMILRSSALGRRTNFSSIENLVQNAETPNVSSASIDNCSNRNDQTSMI